MVVGDGFAEVNAGERREDEGLVRGDQPISKRKKTMAHGTVITLSAARPRITERPPPMKRMSRWPARMFAKSRTESETTRTIWEITSTGTIRISSGPVVPAGIQPLTY